VANETKIEIPDGRAEIHIRRHFDTTVERLFHAHIDPLLIPKWWGPTYLTTTVDLLEPHFGGRWRFVQRAPDGAVHPFRGVYHLVDRPNRLIGTFEYEPQPGAVQLNDMTFRAVGGGAELIQMTAFLSLADRDGMVSAGMRSGLEESVARLDELLARP
jgi:uncharacterized protein YndB with AHSA1/START domain